MDGDDENLDGQDRFAKTSLAQEPAEVLAACAGPSAHRPVPRVPDVRRRAGPVLRGRKVPQIEEAASVKRCGDGNLVMFVSGATATIRRLADRRIFPMLTPTTYNAVPDGPFVCDNDGFNGVDEMAFRAMLAKCRFNRHCLWVTCPDKIGNAKETIRLWNQWSWEICGAFWLKPAFVLQDGQEDLELPKSAVYFIGGSTAFKMSKAAAGLCRAIREKGSWLHVGRVNTRTRIRYAADLGADSFDGSGFSKWPDKRLPFALRCLNELAGERLYQRDLFDSTVAIDSAVSPSGPSTSASSAESGGKIQAVDFTRPSYAASGLFV